MKKIENILSIFTYDSPVGKFIISFNSKVNKWRLSLNDESYGNYNSPVAAADDVYLQVIGSDEWDSFDTDSTDEEVPTDVYEWEHFIKR